MKKGYNIQITTWENDGDNYNTVTYVAGSREEVQEVLDILKYFTESSWKNGDWFGNMVDGESWDRLTEVIAPLCNKIWKIKFPDTTEEPCEGDLDLLWDFGITRSEYYSTRVVDTVKVFFLPEDLKDVTGEFNV